jgi:hypothetical protein
MSHDRQQIVERRFLGVPKRTHYTMVVVISFPHKLLGTTDTRWHGFLDSNEPDYFESIFYNIVLRYIIECLRVSLKKIEEKL